LVVAVLVPQGRLRWQHKVQIQYFQLSRLLGVVGVLEEKLTTLAQQMVFLEVLVAAVVGLMEPGVLELQTKDMPVETELETVSVLLAVEAAQARLVVMELPLARQVTEVLVLHLQLLVLL
jgi:hypothetical protein